MTPAEVIAQARFYREAPYSGFAGYPPYDIPTWNDEPVGFIVKRLIAAEADLAALRAAGFAVVPVKPSVAMAEAGAAAHVVGRKPRKDEMWDACVAWRAMVEAAALAPPPAP